MWTYLIVLNIFPFAEVFSKLIILVLLCRNMLFCDMLWVRLSLHVQWAYKFTNGRSFVYFADKILQSKYNYSRQYIHIVIITHFPTSCFLYIHPLYWPNFISSCLTSYDRIYESCNANEKIEIYKIVMLPLSCTSGKLCLLSHRKISEEVVWAQGRGRWDCK